MDIIIDVHNYGRYKGVALGAAGGSTPTQFADLWKKMAVELKDYPALAGYDLMNEPHDMPTATIWSESAQAATNAIREVDMDNSIIVEGDNWAGAHSWLHSNANLIIRDPANKIVYRAHQYFDKNNSGTYANSYDVEGAYPTMGADRIKPFVDWLKANNLQGMIGETGVSSNDPRWVTVMKNALDYMGANNLDVTAWAGGAWWSPSYPMYVGEPGAPDSAFGDLLETYYNDFDGFGTAVSPPPSAVAPEVVINDMTANEVDGTVTYTLTRSGDLTKASSVNYSSSDGSAAAGSDYLAVSGTLTSRSAKQPAPSPSRSLTTPPWKTPKPSTSICLGAPTRSSRMARASAPSTATTLLRQRRAARSPGPKVARPSTARPVTTSSTLWVAMTCLPGWAVQTDLPAAQKRSVRVR